MDNPVLPAEAPTVLDLSKESAVDPVEQLPVEQQIQLWKVRAVNFELTALNNRLGSMDEARRRANIELQSLPGRIGELQKELQGKQQAGKEEYTKLKKLLNCPEGKEIDLSTGKIIE